MKKCILLIAVIAVVVVSASGAMNGKLHEYHDDIAYDVEMLEKIGESGIRDMEASKYCEENYYYYKVQQDGHGLAIMRHPDGLDASGFTYTMLYESKDGGKNWKLLNDNFIFPRGDGDFVYMGEIAVIAHDCDKAMCGALRISHDRGHSWSDEVSFLDLIEINEETFSNPIPHAINYNEDSGIITFGWTAGYSDLFEIDEYVLINQFDVNTCRFVEEVYRHPDC